MDLEKLKELHRYQMDYFLITRSEELNKINRKIITIKLALNPISSTYVEEEAKRAMLAIELEGLESLVENMTALVNESAESLRIKQQKAEANYANARRSG